MNFGYRLDLHVVYEERKKNHGSVRSHTRLFLTPVVQNRRECKTVITCKQYTENSVTLPLLRDKTHNTEGRQVCEVYQLRKIDFALFFCF